MGPDIQKMIQEQGFENLVVTKLLNIEKRVSVMETSMSWFKYIARVSVIVVLGFFGFDMVGVI